MLERHCTYLSDLVMHHMEDVLRLTRLVEHSVHKLVRILIQVLNLNLLVLEHALGVASRLCNRFQKAVADLLDSGLNFVPVQLLHLVSHEPMLFWYW